VPRVSSFELPISASHIHLLRVLPVVGCRSKTPTKPTRPPTQPHTYSSVSQPLAAHVSLIPLDPPLSLVCVSREFMIAPGQSAAHPLDPCPRGPPAVGQPAAPRPSSLSAIQSSTARRPSTAPSPSPHGPLATGWPLAPPASRPSMARRPTLSRWRIYSSRRMVAPSLLVAPPPSSCK
jgi:hypothetical protein